MTIDGTTLTVIAIAVNIIVTVGGLFFFMGRLTGRLDIQDLKITHMETSLTELKNSVNGTATDGFRLNRVEADIENLESDVRGLRRGVGYVRDGDARAIDREYNK